MTIGPLLVRTIRHFFPAFNDWLDDFPEHRDPACLTYHRRFLTWVGQPGVGDGSVCFLNGGRRGG